MVGTRIQLQEQHMFSVSAVGLLKDIAHVPSHVRSGKTHIEGKGSAILSASSLNPDRIESIPVRVHKVPYAPVSP